MQQQKRRMLRIARLSIEDRRGPNLYVAIAYAGLGRVWGMGHCKPFELGVGALPENRFLQIEK
jgi:hypothetical protein